MERPETAADVARPAPVKVSAKTNHSQFWMQALSLLRPEERHLLSMVNGTWDISTLVLASQGRELDTLKLLTKLLRMGLVQVLPGDAETTRELLQRLPLRVAQGRQQLPERQGPRVQPLEEGLRAGPALGLASQIHFLGRHPILLMFAPGSR